MIGVETSTTQSEALEERGDVHNKLVGGIIEAMNAVTDSWEMVTPTALLTALYAEYDGLLDSLESVQLQLKSKDFSNERTRSQLRNEVHNICEALADVHEKIADFDFVVM
jgi:hypothetical protein